MVDRALKKFLPPVFNLKAYDEEIRSWGYNDWWNALLRRRFAREEVELQEYADPGITSGHGSPEFCEQQVRALLPHLFEKQKMNERPFTFFTFGSRVKDLTAERAVEIHQQVRKSPALLAVIERPESSNWEALEDRPAHPIFQESRDPVYAQTWSLSFPVEVNLRAPDVELRRAFDAWLKNARKTYQIPEPRPQALHRDEADPVLPRGRFTDWRMKRVLAFLDLYIYNRLHNPPPEPKLWKSHKLGWMPYRGEKWTVDRRVWVQLLGLPLDMSEAVFNKKVRQRALDLLEMDMLDLLEMHAHAEQEKKTGPESSTISVQT